MKWFGLHLVIVCWGFTYKISHGCRSLDLINDKSTLVQVMVWFRQAASYYPRQCWQIWVAILRHNVLSTINILSMGIPALATHFWGENIVDRWFSQRHQCCGAFLFVLLWAWIICWKTFDLWFALQRKIHWLSWMSIVPFKDGKLFMIILSSAMPAENQITESTRPSTIFFFFFTLQGWAFWLYTHKW